MDIILVVEPERCLPQIAETSILLSHFTVTTVENILDCIFSQTVLGQLFSIVKVISNCYFESNIVSGAQHGVRMFGIEGGLEFKLKQV